MPSWEPLGLSWGDSLGPLGRLGRCEDRRNENAKHVYFPQGVTRDVPLRSTREDSWAVVKALMPV
eukprot:8965196-Pyramimonas_sp.AAC.1